MSWLQIKELSFWSVILSYSMQQKWTIFQLDCDVRLKSGLNRIIGNDQLSGSTEKKLQSTFQSQTCTKKRLLVTVWWFAARLMHYSFLNPSETIIFEKYAQQIDELPIKTETPTASPGQPTEEGPILLWDTPNRM